MVVDCQSEQNFDHGPPTLRPLRTRARGDVLRPGVPRRPRPGRISRILDGLLRGRGRRRSARSAAEVVTAVFYNFAPSHVARALPAAWDFASPADALRAREASAVAALRRCGVDRRCRRCETAAELLAKAARKRPAGRPPAVRGEPARCRGPTNPVARLWHATTLLREQRGDGHVAVLVANGHQRPRVQRAALRSPTGCPASSSCAAATTTTTSGRSCVDRLAARGLARRRTAH